MEYVALSSPLLETKTTLMHHFYPHRSAWLFRGLLAGMAMASVGAQAGDATSTAKAGAEQAPEMLALSRDGSSKHIIVLPPEASPVEQTAARELAEHLAQVTGAALPITSSDEAPDDRPRLILGDGPLTRQPLPGFDSAKLRPDAIVIKTVGRDLVLAGHPRRGTLYAVFTFLEDVVGVRWWTSTEFQIPRRPTLTIPSLDIEYAPQLIDRSTRYLQLSHGCFRPRDGIDKEERRRMGVFSARLRLNGHDHWAIPDKYGGPNTLLGWVHTFYDINPLLPPEKYFDEHPEWYSLIDGKRTHERGQLCLTNDEMRMELTRNALERLRQTPDPTMISISQNDNSGNCQCKNCQAVEMEEGSPSGLMIRFVNRVAQDIEKEFPEVLVETLAYVYTRKPPRRARPRHNVVVRLCSIECDFGETLEKSVHNAGFREDVKGWSRITPQLYIWDYVTNFSNYLIPHPNLHVLAPNLRYFVRNGAIGVFEQGDSGSRTGEFIRLRAWLIPHLLWDVNADENALIDEFLSGYYGPAAPHLRAYLDLMSNAARRSGVEVTRASPDTKGWLSLETMNAASGLFEAALDAVREQPVLHERVRRERLPLDLVWLRRYDELKKTAEREKLEFRGPEDPAAACLEFIRLSKKHNVGEYRQNHPFSEYEKVLRRSFNLSE